MSFNYIITIYNQEKILPETLQGVARCCSKDSKIIPVLDGCTDGSERVVDEFMADTSLNVEKVYENNVHMLRSVNKGYTKVTSGFVLVVQDDVVLDEPDLEKKIISLYNEKGPNLGVISLRLGANLKRTTLLRRLKLGTLKPMIYEYDYIQSWDDHQEGVPRADYEVFYPRDVAINGPNCIPECVWKKIGYLDEALAPFGYDDDEYCLRASRHGFFHGVFPLKFKSEIEWGGTRKDPKFAKYARHIHKRNRQYIFNKHKEYITGKISGKI